MAVSSSSKSVADLSIIGSHHRNLTVIYHVQNVYIIQGNRLKSISLNSNYSVVYFKGRDASQFRTMAYQICFSEGQWLVNAFTDATSKPYKYLELDHYLSTPKDQTIVTNSFPETELT